METLAGQLSAEKKCCHQSQVYEQQEVATITHVTDAAVAAAAVPLASAADSATSV